MPPASPIQFRPLRADEADEACALARAVFDRCVAPLYGDEGRAMFHRFAQPAALLHRHTTRYVTLVAVEGPQIVGMLHIHARNHVSMLFVAPEQQGCGCGAELVRTAIVAGALCAPLTVNASPNAIGFYAKLGFAPTGEEQTANGVRFQPMRLELSVPSIESRANGRRLR